MTKQHEITPPPELVQEWIAQPACQDYFSTAEEVAIVAARWGFKQCMELAAAWLEAKLQKARDEELEACCEWLVAHGWFGSSNHDAIRGLRTARRPRPPSLAEEALTLLDDASTRLDAVHENTIRRALEHLQELENNG